MDAIATFCFSPLDNSNMLFFNRLDILSCFTVFRKRSWMTEDGVPKFSLGKGISVFTWSVKKLWTRVLKHTTNIRGIVPCFMFRYIHAAYPARTCDCSFKEVRYQSVYTTGQCCFSAAAFSCENNKFSLLNCQVNVVDAESIAIIGKREFVAYYFSFCIHSPPKNSRNQDTISHRSRLPCLTNRENQQELI